MISKRSTIYDTENKKIRVSLLMLDWSVREQLFALDWLNKQDALRETYEIIWIEIYDRILPEALEKADQVITCNQRGLYHKHKAWNEGVLCARGDIVTLCDGDAVFSPDFVSSIVHFFEKGEGSHPGSAVLMHHEWRTASQYPEHGLEKYEDLQQFKWQDLWPNVGACMSVRKKDYIRFGGLDEHQSYRGYLCGPYELGWRMINAGIPEVWHDESIALWHFAHPDPTASYSRKFSLKRWAEIRHIHVNHHAFSAVEAFSSGRVMPRVENETIFRLRMDSRKIGSAFEKKYATMCGKNGFSIYQKARLFVHLLIEPFVHFLETSDFDMVLFLEKKLNRKHFIFLRNTWRRIIN